MASQQVDRNILRAVAISAAIVDRESTDCPAERESAINFLL